MIVLMLCNKYFKENSLINREEHERIAQTIERNEKENNYNNREATLIKIDFEVIKTSGKSVQKKSDCWLYHPENNASNGNIKCNLVSS